MDRRESPSMDTFAREEAMDGVFHALDRLERHLLKDGVIAFQDSRWYLFAKGGESIVSGDSIKKMLVELAMLEE